MTRELILLHNGCSLIQIQSNLSQRPHALATIWHFEVDVKTETVFQWDSPWSYSKTEHLQIPPYTDCSGSATISILALNQQAILTSHMSFMKYHNNGSSSRKIDKLSRRTPAGIQRSQDNDTSSLDNCFLHRSKISKIKSI